MATYTFTGDKPERLAGIEATWDPGTIALLERIGVAPGWRCLEAGGGGGSVATWLADRVSPGGHVLATDLETEFLEAIGHPALSVRRHDLIADDLPAAEFDLAHARLLLEHLGPTDGLERLIGSVRPGGWVLVEDFDWAIGGTADDHAPTHKAYNAILNAMVEHRGYQRHYGRTLLARLDAAGLESTGTEGRAYVVRGGSPGTAFERFSLEALRELLIGTGAVSAEEMDATLEHLADPGTYVLTPVMYAAWGRRPRTG